MHHTRDSITRLGLLLLAAFTLGVTPACGGCGQEGGTIGEAPSGNLVLTPGSLSFSQVAVGDSETRDLRLRNTSSDDLRVFGFTLEAREGENIDGISLVDPPAASTDDPLVIPGNDDVVLEVKYEPVDSRANRGRLVVRSSDPQFVDEPAAANIDTLASLPDLTAIPRQVGFPRRAVGDETEQTLIIRNDGLSNLTIFEPPNYSGGGDFRIDPVSIPESRFPLVLKPYDSEGAATDPDSYVLSMRIVYRPLGESADSGEISVLSNDASSPDPDDDTRGRTVIPVRANADQPCLLVSSAAVNFGQAPVGTSTPKLIRMENCGSRTLEVSGIDLTENTVDEEFELDLQSLDLNEDGALDQTISIEPGDDESFIVNYTPGAEGTDQGMIVISSNDPISPLLELELLGRGANGVCPTAVANGLIRGGGGVPRPQVSAIPLQYIVLDGTQSTDGDGFIPDAAENWEWEVTGPDGIAPTLEPLDTEPGTFKKRQFRLLLAGDYRATLRVRDNANFQSCNVAEVFIRAQPNEKLLIELTWTNPEDPDENDGVGSDVDLHFVKMGPGRWFQSPYDIYFRNPNNGPGSDDNGYWNPESPSLDIDDTDGAGPENIQMNDPQNCEWYALGVHYYRQIFGTAYVTIRVYVEQDLVFEELNVPLQRGGQFWDIARIHWDSGQIQLVNEFYPAAPEGQLPIVTDSSFGEVNMTDSGLCTAAGLY
jgi:hypothetical protein